MNDSNIQATTGSGLLIKGLDTLKDPNATTTAKIGAVGIVAIGAIGAVAVATIKAMSGSK